MAKNTALTSVRHAPSLPHAWMTLHELCFMQFCQLSFISFMLQYLAEGGGALNSCVDTGIELNCLHQHGGE